MMILTKYKVKIGGIIIINVIVLITFCSQIEATVKNIIVGGPIEGIDRERMPEEEKKYELLDKLSYDDEPVDQVIDRFMKQYYNPKEHEFLIKTCIEVVKDDCTYQNRVICARFLGKFKAKTGIQALADNILIGPFDIGNPSYEKAKSTKIGKEKFPAAYALTQIGKPSTSVLLEKLVSLNGEEEEDDVYRLVCLNTIKMIEGDKRAKSLIAGMLEKEKDPLKKQNLERVSKLF